MRPVSEARIVVAMSGGVDSSVAALLAARTGAEVIGVTLQLYDHGEAVKRSGACCAGQDIYDAAQVCEKLGHRPLCARL
jgi:tRNA-specific 2-thiouridylase